MMDAHDPMLAEIRQIRKVFLNENSTLIGLMGLMNTDNNTTSKNNQRKSVSSVQSVCY